MSDDGKVPVHLRVTAEKKGRWIRASRAEGMKLSDWIEKKVDDATPDDNETDRASDESSSA
jgi:hypothetical protein